jgi:hypothetical protein
MGLPSRSFAADAHHCIMVQVRTGPTEYKCVARCPRPMASSASDDLRHRKACGYVDDRLRRPSPLPPLPKQARKAGKCSPSPTYPQAPQQTREIDINGNIRRGSKGAGRHATDPRLLDNRDQRLLRALASFEERREVATPRFREAGSAATSGCAAAARRAGYRGSARGRHCARSSARR